MASNYPGSIDSFRAKQNRAGVSYDPNKQTVHYAEDMQAVEEDVIAIETTLGTNPQGPEDDVAARLARIEDEHRTLFSVYNGNQIDGPSGNGNLLGDLVGTTQIDHDTLRPGSVVKFYFSGMMKLRMAVSQGQLILRFGQNDLFYIVQNGMVGSDSFWDLDVRMTVNEASPNGLEYAGGCMRIFAGTMGVISLPQFYNGVFGYDLDVDNVIELYADWSNAQTGDYIWLQQGHVEIINPRV
jgi:hypothetical protein